MLQPKLKICILGPAYPYRGGIAAFNERLTEILLEQGHEVIIITFTLQYPSVFFPGKSQFSLGPSPKGLTILRKVNTINPITWVTTASWIRHQQFDLIISRFWLPVVCFSMGHIIRRVTRGTSSVGMAIIDNIVPHESRPGDKFFTKYFIGSIDVGLTLSEKVYKKSKEMFPSFDFHCSPHPIYDIYGPSVPRHEAIQQLGLDPSKQYILFFGYIRDYKGLDLLLDAFGLVSSEFPTLRILVAGEFYAESEKYHSLIEDLGIKDKVIMHTDFIADEQVKYYFGASDLVSQTYKSASQSGISQIAINFEKPMICTDVGGLPEVMEKGVNGIVVRPEPADIARGIATYFNHQSRYYDREKIKSLKHNYSWETFSKKVIEIYQKHKALKHQ